MGACLVSLKNLPPVMGHRGAAGVVPENTLASIAKVAQSGVDWVEFDVMLTGDDVPVLFHDDSLERTTGQKGLMAEATYESLRRLEAGAWFGEAFAGEPIPTLAEAVELILELGLRANVEIKPTKGRDRVTAEVVMAELSRIWPGDRPVPMICSFERECLQIARTFQPGWPRAFVCFDVETGWREILEGEDCVSFHVLYKRLTEQQVADIKAAGFLTASFTVNDGETARRLRDWGVDCMISDHPGDVLRALA